MKVNVALLLLTCLAILARYSKQDSFHGEDDQDNGNDHCDATEKLSKRLYAAASEVLAEVAKHPAQELVATDFGSGNHMLFLRFFENFLAIAPTYAHNFERWVTFVASDATKNKFSAVAKKFSDANTKLLEELRKYFGQGLPMLDNPKAPIGWALTLYHWDIMINDRDPLVFLASVYCSLQHISIFYDNVNKELLKEFPSLKEFQSKGSDRTVRMVAKMIDSFAPKCVKKELANKLTKTCLQFISFEFPTRYDYFVSGEDVMPDRSV